MGWDRIGSESADTQNFLDRIWKNGIVASLTMTSDGDLSVDLRW